MSPPIRLHVNIDHVATLRNARGTVYPDPTLASKVSLDAGAHGITAHLREDRRHIKDDDVARLRDVLVGSTFNLEMAATNEMLEIALSVKPDVVTLVPERREERTTEGGLAVAGNEPVLQPLTKRLVDAGIKVSHFIAPVEKEIDAALACGATQIELHTGEYAHGIDGEIERLRKGAGYAHSIGLEVAAGHGLTAANVPELVKIPEIVELNIGHAIIADSIFFSLGGAVREMLRAIETGVALRGR